MLKVNRKGISPNLGDLGNYGTINMPCYENSIISGSQNLWISYITLNACHMGQCMKLRHGCQFRCLFFRFCLVSNILKKPISNLYYILGNMIWDNMCSLTDILLGIFG